MYNFENVAFLFVIFIFDLTRYKQFPSEYMSAGKRKLWLRYTSYC